MMAVVLYLATLHAGRQATAPATVPSAAEIDRIVTRVLQSSGSSAASAADIRARIWADATTFQLRRDRWQIVALNPALPDRRSS
jgi:hypothetical protein